MRIWLLTSELPDEIAGGIARYVDNWARMLGAAGHEVTVIARTDRYRNEQLAPGVRLIGVVARYDRLHEANPGPSPDTHPAFPYNIFAYWPALSYQMAEEVLRLLEEFPPPDIIESQEYAALPYFLLQRKLTERTPLEKIPIVLTLHSPAFELARVNHEPRYRFPDYWVGQMEKFCIVAADALVTPTAFPAQRIASTLQQPLKAVTIPHPLMVHRPCLPHLAQPKQLVYVGRIQVLKGILPLVKECSRMWEAGEQFHLALIGGDLEFHPRGTTVCDFLRKHYAKWIEHGQLELAGVLNHATVLQRMQSAWTVIIPSFWESFSYTCMEAMAVGQVVLASRSGGQAELVGADGQTGFLFDWELAGDFQKQVRTILALSAAEHADIALRAQARIRSLCDPQKVLQQRINYYEQIQQNYALPTRFPAITPPVRAEMDREETWPVTSPERPAEEKAGLLSVVIPYYNLGEYLPETVESVLSTAYSPYEIIIVNDGTTDPNSLEVLRALEQRQLNHLRIIHTDNQGLASARNNGVEAAQGEFIAFVDADDLVEPDFFSRAVEVLRRYPNVTLVYPWLRYFGESTDLWPTWNAEFPYLLGHNMVAVLAVARRTDFLHLARQQPEMEYNFEDFEAWIALLRGGGVGVSLPHLLARYRIRSGSLYRSSNKNQQLYLYDLMTQRHTELYQYWGVELFNLLNANGPGFRWNHPAIETMEISMDYVTALEQDRKKLAADVRTLGKAWEDHVGFIESQRVYIEQLEARCRELLAAASYTDTEDSLNGALASWRDYQIGGRLVSRVRRSWLTRQVLRYPKFKSAIKRALLGETDTPRS